MRPLCINSHVRVVSLVRCLSLILLPVFRIHDRGIIRSKPKKLNDHTSGTPSRGCPEGKLDASSTNGRCSESGKRAIDNGQLQL